MNTRKITFLPETRGGRTVVSGNFAAISFNSGTVNFSRDLCEQANGLIFKGQRVAVDYNEEKVELKVYPHDNGFTLGHISKDTSRLCFTAKALSSLDHPDMAVNGKNSGRFRVRILKSCIIVQLTKRFEQN